MLKTNHRQGEDKKYADILNRIRVGDIQEDDIKCLAERVRAKSHPDIPEEALVITCKNKDVNAINERKLARINEPEITSEAQTKTQTLKKLNAKVDASGSIRNTPLQKILKLKVGARVMLTHNINTCDSLTNGTFGEVIGLELDDNKCLKRVIVSFDNELSGKERRKNYIQLQQQYFPKLATPIDRIEFHYSLSRKPTSAAANAIAVQFPLRLAFAATAHKIQGSTIKKPNHLVVDLRSVMEAAQAYVMLSRVQALSQLFILDEVCVKKIYASKVALEELDKINVLAMNNHISRKKVFSCNIRSLKCHYKDLLSTPSIKTADVICLQETWLTNDSKVGQIPDFLPNFNNAGRGKGVATYYRKNFTLSSTVKQDLYQISKVTSDYLDVVNVYRSDGASSNAIVKDLLSMIDQSKSTLIVGDLNICYLSQRSHPVISFLESNGFCQLVKSPTHVDGRLIDHVYHYTPEHANKEMNVEQQSPYYTDHDIIWIS